MASEQVRMATKGLVLGSAYSYVDCGLRIKRLEHMIDNDDSGFDLDEKHELLRCIQELLRWQVRNIEKQIERNGA